MINVLGGEWLPRRNGKIHSPRVALLIVLTGLLALSLSRPFLLLTNAISHSEGVSWRLWGYAALLIIGAAAAWIDSPPTRMATMPPLIVVLIIWSAFSIAWSVTPGESVRRLSLTAISMWLAFVAADRLGARRVFLIAQFTLSTLLVINYAALVLYPSLAIDNYGVNGIHYWQGVMSQKNFAGMSSGLTVLFFSLYGSRITLFPRLLVATTAAIFLVFTESRTSIIATAIADIFGVSLFFAFSRSRGFQASSETVRNVLLAMWIALATVLVLLIVDGRWLLNLTRNPDLFTGRAQIWQPMLLSLFEHPFSGVGYGAYWTGGTVLSSGPLAGVTQAHNGYLDLVVQIGLPGLLIAVGGFIGWPILLIAQLMSGSKGNSQISSLGVAVLIFFCVNNFAESSLFDGDQIPQVFMTLTIAALASTLRRQKDPALEKSNSRLGDLLTREIAGQEKPGLMRKRRSHRRLTRIK